MSEAEYFVGVNARLDHLLATQYVALLEAARGDQETFAAAVEALRLEAAKLSR
jgi:hypothetical protein